MVLTYIEATLFLSLQFSTNRPVKGHMGITARVSEISYAQLVKIQPIPALVRSSYVVLLDLSTA